MKKIKWSWTIQFLLFLVYPLTANIWQLTALSVRSHWKTISRICVSMVLLVLARSILLTPASATQLWYWSWASSAWPNQWIKRIVWRCEWNVRLLSTMNVMKFNCNALLQRPLLLGNAMCNYYKIFPLLSSPLPTLCKASSSSLLFFSSCLLATLDCSSWERLLDEWAFWYSSLLWAFSARALRKDASASCCQNHTKQTQIRLKYVGVWHFSDQMRLCGWLSSHVKWHSKICKQPRALRNSENGSMKQTLPKELNRKKNSFLSPMMQL